MTVSAWWVLWAFLGGGYTGILVMAMMYFASAEDDRRELPLDIHGAGSPNPPRVIAEPM